MAQDASEIREAIEQTRDDIGETLQAIGQKTDVKARAAEKVAATRDSVKESTAEVKAKVSDVAQHLAQKVPDAVQPAVSSAAQWAKSTVGSPSDAGRRKKVAMCIGLASTVVVLTARRARRRRHQPC
jgi:methyl-accepting chemotaxis protein